MPGAAFCEGTGTGPRAVRTGENFPVASVMIRSDLRPAIAAFYRFARAADDVADHPDLLPADKLAHLSRFSAGLRGDPEGEPAATALRACLAATGRRGLLWHADALLGAFRQDAVQGRYAHWADLLDYCSRSANPVGRFVLDLHGEGQDCPGPSDALCTTLQLLNHLQDLADDKRRLDRVYLPTAWLAAAGTDAAALGEPTLSPPMRGVIDQALAITRNLLAVAATLPSRLRSRRLRGEVATILHLAWRLQHLLERSDPLARRPCLSRADFLTAAAVGAWTGLRPFRSTPTQPALGSSHP